MIMQKHTRVKKPTIKDVAKAAGVSTATVSYVLNDRPGVSEETKQRVLDVIRMLGYQPDATARSLVSRQTRTLGFVVQSEADQIFSDPFYQRFLRGLGQVVREREYFLLLFMPRRGERFADACFTLASQKRVDGIIVPSAAKNNLKLTDLEATGIPIVVVGAIEGVTDRVGVVDVDNERGLYEIAQHVISLGHRRIGYIGGDLSLDFAVARFRGYQRAVEEAGIVSCGTALGDFTSESGYDCAKSLLRHVDDGMTAIVCASDLLALGAMQALREYGLDVPKDISVTGFDDIPAASHTNPPLTTVNQPVETLGEAAANLLIDLIEHKETKTRLTFETTIVVRGTTAPPRATP